MDPEPCRLLYVAGGTSKAEVKSSQELLSRQESDKTTGFEWTVTSRRSERVHSTLGGPQPRVEDKESPIHGVCGIVTVQDQKLGSEAGTNGQEHEYSVARPEGMSSGSSLSLTPAPVGLNECGPLFSSSNSHGSE